MLLWEELVEV